MAVQQDQRWQKDATDQNFDYMFKLLIIGNSSVGKTSFLFRYADDSFTSAFVSTVGIDFKVKTVFRNDKRVKLQIWVRKLLRGCHQKKCLWRLYVRVSPKCVWVGMSLKKYVINSVVFTYVYYSCSALVLWDEWQKFGGFYSDDDTEVEQFQGFISYELLLVSSLLIAIWMQPSTIHILMRWKYPFRLVC